MSRTCIITGRTGLTGNRVSHANNKTKRRFQPNLQSASLLSEILGQTVALKISTRGLKTIEKNGGLDAYLLGKPNSRLTEDALKIKKRIIKARDRKAGTAKKTA
ncbi:MAG: 50S ribosomal protein L28 [Alphaproteobacteria bacterium]|nr:50S ribosomal protein L28 [Alphaproteobacteria bacterium]